MGITGSESALMEARSGEARFGATRFGYVTPTPHVLINGSEIDVELSSIRWQEQIDDRRDSLVFKIRGTASVELSGATIDQPKVASLAIGDPTAVRFEGPIQKVKVTNKSRGQTAAGQVWEVRAYDYARDLRRMLVTKRYTSESASDIALDLLSAGAAPTVADDANRTFTGNQIEAGLATVDEISFKYTAADKALNRLAERINAHWYVDQAADLHFFTGDEGIRSAQDLDADDAGYWDLEMTQDDSSVITQAIIEGKGSQIASAVQVGDSTVPLEEAALFDATGGAAVIGSDPFTYTGISTDTLTGVSWDNTDATDYEAGEYVGQILSRTLTGAPTATYQRTSRFHRDRRVTDTEADEMADSLTEDHRIRAKYKTRDPNARVGAAVTVNRTTSHLSSSYTAGIIIKQTTKWKSRDVMERSVEVGERTRTRMRSFFENQDDGKKD